MYTSPPTSSYSSPPPPHDPYRSSPIPVATRQPYAQAFSPPPMHNGGGGGYAQMPVPRGQQPQRYNQYSSRSQPGQQRYQSPQPHGPHSSHSGYGNGVPAQPSQLPPAKHKGTLAPGQLVQVGEQTVRIERYLSEGGYAHVYLTTSESPIYPPVKGDKRGRWGERGYTQHCLKRIAFEDEAVWADVRKEIEVMKALPPNPHLTQYLGSAHSKLPKGGYEVFILMEFCAGGGIIDLLNKRLRDRLKEIEILNIFTDVCEAVAAMHALSRPLLHRDLKIENVLSSPNGQSPSPQRPTALTFKLCDFGSTTFPASQPPKTKLESDALALDLNKHTTLQYRSPEMVEPMLGWAVGLPSDVWALGVLLYKLCYYTTPFEEHGTLAIVNAKYTFPQYPVYSPRLQHLIASMLIEQPVRRPSVFEVLKTAHEMSGTRPEVDYATPSRSFNSVPHQPKPTQPPSSSSNLLDFTSPTSPVDRSNPILQPDIASAIQPQRRGRPTREPSQKAIPQAASAPANPPMPIPSKISRPQPTPPASSGRPASPRLQITGEKQKSPPKPSASLDAFGMPSLPAPPQPQKAGSGAGFGDSFEAPSNTSQRLGSQLQRPPSGFGDSFGAGAAGTPSVGGAVKKGGASPSDRFGTSYGVPRTTSPPTSFSAPQRSPDPSSSIPDGEVSFETRFPSIETLSSGDAFSPPLQTSASRPGSTQPQPQLISPITSPPVRNARTLSMMGNLTGGDLANHHLSAQTGAPPQPRSTNVTGTAFKGIQGGLLSPNPSNPPNGQKYDPSQPKKDYFESANSTAGKSISPVPTSSSARSGVPPDLMTGDDFDNEEGMGGASSLRPTLSSRTSSSRPLPQPPSHSANPPAQAAPAIGHSRPLLPHIESARPSTNIDSPLWSPLENLRKLNAKPDSESMAKSNPTEKGKEVSSDEEEGPEDASGLNRRPSTRKAKGDLASRMSAFEIKGESNDGGPEKQKSSTTPLPSSSSRPDTQRFNAGTGGVGSGRSRPQSMYASPSFGARGTAFSPPSSAGLPTPTETGTGERNGRPGHVRKGSINDIVSKYESLASPPLPTPSSISPTATATAQTSGYPQSQGQGGAPLGGLQRKPSVAAKPQALRKPTLDGPHKQEQQADKKEIRSTPTSPVKPNKPKDLIPVKPVPLKPKPESIRQQPQPQVQAQSQAVKYGQGPSPAGYSKSSSGRSFPVTKLPPVVSTAQNNQDGGEAANGSLKDKPRVKTPEDSGSPESQQPVNLLIQRWNQGQVGKR